MQVILDMQVDTIADPGYSTGAGLQDEAGEVRNAALYALGQFAEHFQPDITKYSDEVSEYS